MKNNKIIKICEQRLIFLNYANSTKNTYLNYIEKFVGSLDKQIIHCNSKDFWNCKYLHTFQNLYFSLTGTELKKP